MVVMEVKILSIYGHNIEPTCTIMIKIAVTPSCPFYLTYWLRTIHFKPMWILQVSECCDPEIRGRLGSLPTLAMSLGIVLSYVAGNWLTWRYLAFFSSTFCGNYVDLKSVFESAPRYTTSYVNFNFVNCRLYVCIWQRFLIVFMDPKSWATLALLFFSI